MPIVVALMLLWIGSLLDMASTYYVLSASIGDEIRIREVNQYLTNSDGDLLLVNMFIINGVFLFALSLAMMFPLKNRNMVKKYIQETGYFTHVKDGLFISNKKDDLLILNKNLVRKEDFVSRRVIFSVSILMFAGTIGGVRFLFSINNLMEYYVHSGFMSLFLGVFPALHEYIALTIVFLLLYKVSSPFTYLLLRLSAR